MAEPRAGRPRDAQLDHAILAATRALLTSGSYADLTMERIAAEAGVGKKTLYRRWPSKAPLVADAVLNAYGRDGSFPVPDTGDLRADLLRWLTEHGEFIAEPANANLIRALIAASAASPGDHSDLYGQLSVPQHAGLLVRLRSAVDSAEIRADADLDAVARALIGTLLLRVLTRNNDSPATGFAALLDVLLDGVSGPD